ncbi:MAG: HU family DNA-binding protein [Verrucomicrobiales bacterium]|jgi:DNA-binding protein HU-beta|nr:HU family DNA-binding protein [Verrucomicrobiales bacterium]
MDARVLLLHAVRSATLRDDHLTKGEIQMAKMTKTATIAAVAEAADISKIQAKAAMDEIASLAYANARDGFVIPGIGKVSVRQTKARKMVMRFGPNEGKEIDVKAKTKLKFTFLKAAKEAIGVG